MKMQDDGLIEIAMRDIRSLILRETRHSTDIAANIDTYYYI